jgi:outer membrane receptor protein involved in Fe transport
MTKRLRLSSNLFTGLRIESTKETLDAFAVDSNNNQQPISSSHRYTDFLPSLQTRYELTPSLVGRAIYSSTIARPGFNQLTPGLSPLRWMSAPGISLPTSCHCILTPRT